MLKSPLLSVLDIEEATLKVFFLVTENPIIAKNFTKNLSLKNKKKSKQKKNLTGSGFPAGSRWKIHGSSWRPISLRAQHKMEPKSISD